MVLENLNLNYRNLNYRDLKLAVARLVCITDDLNGIIIDDGDGLLFLANDGTYKASDLYVHPNHTGDVTSVADGATTIAAGVVTNTKLSDVATATIKGRITAATGVPEDLTVAEVTSMLNIFTASLKGLVPLSGGGTANFLRADGAWSAPSSITQLSDLSDVVSSTNTDKFVLMADGTTGFISRALVEADISDFGTYNNYIHPNHSGDVTSVADGATTISNGVVTNTKLATITAATFKGRVTIGTGVVEDLTVTQATSMLNTFTSSLKGLTPLSGGGTANFLRADGTWSTPVGTAYTHPNHSGEVTSIADGATTIVANIVTNAKLAQIATATFKGRVTAATGNVEDLTGTQATTLLDVFTLGLKGLAPASGGGTTNFLRADGTWTTPPDTIYTHPNHTGDVTSIADGVTTISNNVVTNAKLADVLTATFKGRITAATGDPEDLTGTQATTLLDNFTSSLKGLAPLSGGGTTNFLRADATWAVPPDTDTVYTHPNHSGDVTSVADGATTIASNVVTNAKMANVPTSTFKGRVTAATGDPEDLTGTQATTMLNVFSSSLKGLTPLSGGGTTKYLRADGTWSVLVPGSTTQVIFNDVGVLGAHTGLLYSKTDQRLTIGTVPIWDGTASGSSNIGIGIDTFGSAPTGYNNLAFGTSILELLTTGNSNTIIGAESAWGVTTGSGNTVLGSQALQVLTTGDFNIAVGEYAFRGLGIASSANIAIGYLGGRYLNDGITELATATKNIYIGGSTKSLAQSQQYEVVIGHEALGKGSDTVVIGRDSTLTNPTIGNYLTGAIGVNVSSIIDATSILQLDSTTKGLLMPRMTGAQVEAISTPTTGLLAFASSAGSGDVTSASWWGFNGASWVNLAVAGATVPWGGITGTLSAQTDLQTELDAKQAKLLVINAQVVDYTLVIGDADKLIEMNKATALTLTIPANASVAYPIGTQILIYQEGAGQLTIAITSDTLNSSGSKTKLTGQYSAATLIKTAATTWLLSGDIST
jgi:hypothetical protein